VAISSATELRQRLETSWPVESIQRQQVYLVVIALLAAYPAVYHLLSQSPLANETVALLPRMETMVGVLYFALFAMSFDFISGYTGYLSFGHAAFYGTGAYTVLLIANGKVPLLPPETPFVATLLIGAVLATVLAVVIGLVSFRLTGVYFAMITLGFTQVMYVFVRDWDYVGSNPRDGIALSGARGFELGVPYVDQLTVALGTLTGDTLTLFGHTLGTTTVSFYAIGVVVLLCYLGMQRIVHSPFGRVMVAIRENEERAEAIGYDTFRYKLGAFAISGFFGGVAGGLLAGFKRSVTPETGFYFLTGGDALLASIIGGFGTLAGPLWGHLFDEVIREFLSKQGQGGGLLPYLREALSEGVLTTELVGGLTVEGFITAALNGHASLYVGVVFVLFVLYVPDGLVGTVRDRLGGPVARRLPERLWGER